MKPKKIKIEDSELNIEWDDETESSIPLNKLRMNCPCAYCNKEREEQSRSYIPVYSDKQMEISGIKKIGNYAIGIDWKDGHNTGIFEFNNLKNLAK